MEFGTEVILVEPKSLHIRARQYPTDDEDEVKAFAIDDKVSAHASLWDVSGGVLFTLRGDYTYACAVGRIALQRRRHSRG